MDFKQSNEHNRSEQQVGSSTTKPSRHHSNVIAIETSSSSSSEDEMSGCKSAFAAVGGSPCGGRKPRTTLTEEQLLQLEKTFKKSRHLGFQDKAELCKRLGLSKKQVRTWFQNRRMKQKRNLQHTAYQTMASSHQWHWPQFQLFDPGFYAGFSPTLVLDGQTAYVPLGLCYNPFSAMNINPHPLFLDTYFQHHSSLPSMAMLSGGIPAIPSFYSFPPAESHHVGGNLSDQQPSVWKG